MKAKNSVSLIQNRYGYRGTDSRRNLWVLPTGELLYYVAAVAVMYDRDEETQRHYTGHTEDIQWYQISLLHTKLYSAQRLIPAWTFILPEKWWLPARRPGETGRLRPTSGFGAPKRCKLCTCLGWASSRLGWQQSRSRNWWGLFHVLLLYVLCGGVIRVIWNSYFGAESTRISTWFRYCIFNILRDFCVFYVNVGKRDECTIKMLLILCSPLSYQLGVTRSMNFW